MAGGKAFWNPIPAPPEADFAAGTGEIADTATSESIAHGLGVVPETVLLTPRANEALWVSSRDASSFTAERSGSSGALAFDWLATGEEVVSTTPAYYDEVLADGPVLFLPLDDASGATASALAGSDGAYVGTPTFLTPGPGSALPYGIATDGGSDYVTFGALAGLGYDKAQTWEMWVYSATGISSATTNRPLIGQQYGTNQRWIGVGNINSGISGEVLSIVTANSGGSNSTYWSGFTIPAGWHHVAFVFAGGATANAWTCYLDGVNVTDPSIGGTKSSIAGGAYGLLNTIGFSMSAYKDGSTYTPGNWEGLSALAVYDKAVSAARLAAHVGAAD